MMKDLAVTGPFRVLQIFTLLLAAFAFLHFLGYVPVGYVDDESRRVLVAKEMMLSGDYITPTLNGEIYLNKPPLYNWVIVVFMQVFGENSFAVRLTVIISLFVFCYIIFACTKKYTGNSLVAYVTALSFMTNGRILFFDSFIGLIDISSGMLMYSTAMLIFYFGSKQKWLLLFSTAYALTAAGYLMKGFPSVVFLGFTLLAWFISTKNFKRLFSLQHVAGTLFFIIPVLVYYYVFFSRNDLSLSELFGRLFTESTKRASSKEGLIGNVKHVFTFPFEMFYHFAPWLLLSLVFLKKGSLNIIRANTFIHFNLVALLVNISVYWISPGVHPRYLFMLLPMYLVIIVYLFYQHLKNTDWQYKIIEWIFGACCLVFCLGMTALPFLTLTADLPAIWPKSVFLFISAGLIFYLYIKKQAWRLPLFVLMLVIARIGFNWIALYQRGDVQNEIRNTSLEITRIAGGAPLYIFPMNEIPNTDTHSFFIEKIRNHILLKNDSIDYNAYYIGYPSYFLDKSYQSYMTFMIPHSADTAHLVKFLK